MAAAATNIAVDFDLGDIGSYPVVASEVIWQGRPVWTTIGTGYAKGGATTPAEATDAFLGFALEKVDNATGSSGDKNVKVRTRGRAKVAIGSAAITDIGKGVYITDDDTFTLTASTNLQVGVVAEWVATGVVMVKFDAGIKLMT